MVCLIYHVVYSCISFILISSLPLCNYTIDYLSILLYMDMWIVSSFWLLRSVLLWTFFYMCFGENMYIFLLCIYLGGELQGPKLCVCSAFVSSAKKYSLVAIAKDTTSSSVWMSSCFMPSTFGMASWSLLWPWDFCGQGYLLFNLKLFIELSGDIISVSHSLLSV